MGKVTVIRSWQLKKGNWSYHPEYIKFWTDTTEVKKPKRKRK